MRWLKRSMESKSCHNGEQRAFVIEDWCSDGAIAFGDLALCGRQTVSAGDGYLALNESFRL